MRCHVSRLEVAILYLSFSGAEAVVWYLLAISLSLSLSFLLPAGWSRQTAAEAPRSHKMGYDMHHMAATILGPIRAGAFGPLGVRGLRVLGPRGAVSSGKMFFLYALSL